MSGTVISVNKSDSYSFSKLSYESISLIEGKGVHGDVHQGKLVKHRSRIKRDPSQPNLRQVHLIHCELLEELENKGFHIKPGELGENITTRNIELLDLPKDAVLLIGEEAKIQITGLRNPCNQLNTFMPGLLNELIDKDSQGNLIRKAGIMGVVLKSGNIKIGDEISILLPSLPHRNLDVV